jgi:hypothetical protein
VSNPIRPSYLDAYLVAENSGAPPQGAVRRHGHVWRIYLLGSESEEQPREVFATRDEAGFGCWNWHGLSPSRLHREPPRRRASEWLEGGVTRSRPRATGRKDQPAHVPVRLQFRRGNAW